LEGQNQLNNVREGFTHMLLEVQHSGSLNVQSLVCQRNGA
jgi:hypothetical protein